MNRFHIIALLFIIGMANPSTAQGTARRTTGHWSSTLPASTSIPPPALGEAFKVPQSSSALVEIEPREIARLDAALSQSGPGPQLVGVEGNLSEPLVLDPGDPRRVARSGAVGRFLSDGSYLWCARVVSPGAGALRLRIAECWLDEGAQIQLYNSSFESVFHPVRNGTVSWTRTVAGEDVFIEVLLPAGAWRESRLVIDQASHISPEFAPASNTSRAHCSNNAFCIENALCHTDADFPAIDQAEAAVAFYRYQDGGTFNCTLSLVADTDESTDIPYLLTANHCIDNEAAANSAEIFFNHQTTCGTTSCPNTSTLPSLLGATLLHNSASTDVALMQMDDPAPEGAFFLGWTAEAVLSTSAENLFRVSHPLGRPQAFTKHLVTSTASVCGASPRPRFIYTTNVVGSTESGSSGSPLMTDEGLIVGQLFGCCNAAGGNCNQACNASNLTMDGAFSESFSALSEWLDPVPLPSPSGWSVN